MEMKDETPTFAIFGTTTRRQDGAVCVWVFPVVPQPSVFINRESVALWLGASAKGDDNKGLPKT